MRTTLDINDPVLKELNKMQRRERKSLGKLVSELVSRSLAKARAGAGETAAPFVWIAKPMGARVDLADKDALPDAMDARAR
ncbi:MAG: antitoxin [Burkholderiales bacterium]|nr:antitoxin [Burkholderiales bacterium]